MDFDIDSFLNETFKKVEKKEKKKTNDNKISQINDLCKEEKKNDNLITQNDVILTYFFLILISVGNLLKILQKIKNNNFEKISIEKKNANNQPNNLNNITSFTNMIDKEVKNEKLLSNKTQRIIEQNKIKTKNIFNNSTNILIMKFVI